MNSTILHHTNTDTYTLNVYNTAGALIHTAWCSTSALCRRIASSYNSSVTFIN